MNASHLQRRAAALSLQSTRLAIERRRLGRRTVRTKAELESSSTTTADLKRSLLTIACKTDRGQLLFREPVYNLDGYNKAKVAEAREIIDGLIRERGDGNKIADQTGTWELVFSTAQLFRCSPFFLAISESFDGKTFHMPWSDPETAVPSGNLFFRLHELQVMSWGASTIGRVTQTVDLDAKTLSSTFDTILFRLTVIPIVGFFKLLPTFGGRVASYADKLEMKPTGDGRLELKFELQETEVSSVEGIPRPPFFLAWLLDRKFPVNAVWKLLPWNRGKAPTCTSFCTYCDQDLRICEDKQGEVYVYVRTEDQ